MRRKVPFIGEEHIVRATDEQSSAKKTRGALIDDVLSTSMQASSWDDLVTSNYPDPTGVRPRQPKPHASVPHASMPKAHAPVAKPHRPAVVPFAPGPIPKKASFETSTGSLPTNTNSTSVTGFAASATGTSTIDWLPINNGHGLRINICGSLDQNLRNEWRRLLEETADNGIGQFEFNLSQAPSLSLTGLGMLLMFKEQKGSEKGDIKLCQCNKEVWQMLQWTGMDKYFTIQSIPGMDK